MSELVTIPDLTTMQMIEKFKSKKSWMRVMKIVYKWDFMAAPYVRRGATYRIRMHSPMSKVSGEQYTRLLKERFDTCVGCPAAFFTWAISCKMPPDVVMYIIPDSERVLEKNGQKWSLEYLSTPVGDSIGLSPLNLNGCGSGWLLIGFEPV